MAVSPTSSSCDSNSCCGVSLLGRAFGVSISIPVLILSVAALAVIPLGWQLGGMLFVGSEAMENENDENPLRDLVKAKSQTGFISPLKDQYEPQWWWSSQSGWVREQQEQEGAPSLWLGPWNGVTRSLVPERGTISGVYTELVEPARKFFDRDAGWNELALYTLGGLWTLLVYALFGGAISRIAVVQLGRGERVSLTDSLRHSIRKLRSYFMAPLFVIIASVLLALLIAVPSLLIRASGWGSVAVGVFWVILLILAAAMAVLLIVLSFGWPLMWGAISAEETGDVFEATSRSFSYTIQRPLKYACYVIVALIIGGLGWWLVDLVTSQVVDLALWSASWGGGFENVNALASESATLTSSGAIGANIINFCNDVVRYLVVAYTFSFFFAGFAAIYLLLRKDADQTELDEVYMSSEEAQFELPQLHEPAESEASASEEEAAGEEEPAGQEEDTGQEEA